MEYKGDLILPLLNEEISKRTQEFKGLSQEDESALLSLSETQKKLIADQDRKTKVEFLTKQPKINNAGVKVHEKFKQYVSMVHNANKSDVKA
jgi:uncharacterized protein YukE